MAQVDYTNFKDFTISIGDGASPEVFTARCTMNASRGFSLSGEMTERNIPDCSDDLLPSAMLRYLSSYSGEISGSGVLEAEDEKFFSDWLTSGVKKNVRVRRGGTGGTQWAFAAVCSQFSVTGEQKDVVNAEITLQSHGEITTSVIS